MSEKTSPKTIETEKLSGVTGGISGFGGTFGSGINLWQPDSGGSSGGGIGVWQPGGGGEQPIDVSLGEGNDKRDGTSGNDTIQAQGGNDTVWGGAGDDKIFGGQGHDWLQGGAGADEIHGDGGNDYIEGNALGADADGAGDLVFAGDGNDTFAWTKGSGDDVFHGQGGVDTLRLQDVNRDELLAGLRADNTQLLLKAEGDGVYSFVWPNGSPAHDVSGTFTLNGETVTFYNLEKVKIG
jgi:Ca2+-binding RTX toxin-like protein